MSAFFLEYFVLAATYSPPFGVPSVLQGLTAEFGMGSGVTPASSHQDKVSNRLRTVLKRQDESCPKIGWGRGRYRPRAADQLTYLGGLLSSPTNTFCVISSKVTAVINGTP